MKKYIGTKILEAKSMNRGDYNIYRGWTIPSNEDPEDEGYLVKYQDGYESWSPKEVFEESYKECNSMTFGIAVELMKKGCKVARQGWNGKGMYVFKAPKMGCQMLEQFTGKSINDINEFLVIKNVNDTLSTWVPSINDCLSDDWVIVD